MTVDLSVQYFIATGTIRDQLNMRCSIPMQGSYWSPGTHPTNDISIEFEIFPKFCNALVHIIFSQSQWNFAHVMTV